MRIGTVPQLHRKPRRLASSSVNPTTGTCGSVKMVRGITVWSTDRRSPLRALGAAMETEYHER
jgi:hypothetical protein